MDGKVDWMAFGLPVEGAEGPFLGQIAAPVATCDVGATVGDARRILEERDATELVVVAAGGLAVGALDAEAIERVADDGRVLDVMDPVPSTVRPSITVAALAEAGGGQRLVTTSDGVLQGLATVEGADHDHEGHDHEGHDHEGHDHEGHEHEGDGGSGDGIDMERYERELTEVMGAIEEQFGDREPSEDELRAFLRERLVVEGRSAEDADRFLDEMARGDDGG